MSKAKISLSILLEEIVSDFIKHTPGFYASFEIENNVMVKGNYERWRYAIQSIIENTIRFSTGIAQPAVAFGRLESKSVYVVMDNGAQFFWRPADTIITVFLYKVAPEGMSDTRRIVIRRGNKVWKANAAGTRAFFYFSVN